MSAARGPLSAILRICAWCLLAVLVEIALYLSYRGHDARFHYATHLFVGASTALVIMSVVAWRRGRAVPYPLVWPVLGHLFAMFPDVLFSAGIAHYRWMDVFLGHISTHFVPGRNLTWALVFLGTLGAYLVVIARLPSPRTAARRQ
ncbi:hypothetical protein [Pseudonocardia nigra]|uniref:hypothetical protein n=1 Tax=Pseudonocardia nigra TaxID=1921578 RepID=UPI001C5F0BB9|nr:hypothetical protein [Pseudonocardia nigra]